MKTFLGNVAESLWREYGSGISSMRMLVPNARSRIFFAEELSSLVDRPLWEPRFVTVDELMFETAGIERADRIRSIVELYKIYSEYHRESFDQFYYWGEMLLGDFDQTDKYMVDARRLFSNLCDLKTLEDNVSYLSDEQREVVRRFWTSFGREETHSGEKRDFLRIWDTLYDIYMRFRERLAGEGMAYDGMAHRTAAEKIKAGETQLSGGRYAVIGFNALSECEKVLFGHLRDSGAGDFFWDYDEYYVSDRQQEAGLFIRQNIASFPMPGYFDTDNDNFRGAKDLTVVSAGSDSMQCKYAATFLRETTPESGKAGRETVIVLTDENLLMPLLYSVPEEVGDVNVTMGYPLRQTLAYSFVERLLNLQGNMRQRPGGAEFYHADVGGLLTHPYVAVAEREKADMLNAGIIAKSKIYVREDFFPREGIIGKIFAAQDKWENLLPYIKEILAAVSTAAGTGDGVSENGARETVRSAADREFFAVIAETLSKLSNSLDGCGVELNIRILSSLARRVLQSVRVPFSGEPLSGMQVMGILETRNIDFVNVMIMSMNDDNFPGTPGAGSSFIPHNLRLAYGLPTPRHHEGVYAYYFYRLLQRARSVHMVYCSRNDEGSSGEQSRYIYQLEYESPHEITRRQVGAEVNFPVAEEITIGKSGYAREKLNEYLDGGGRSLSPSAFNSYLDCPLKFYFRYIADIKPGETVAEEVDVPMFGTILHKAMEILYAPLCGEPDPRGDIKALIGSRKSEDAVDEAIAAEFFKGEGVPKEEYGGNLLLARDVALKYIDGGILPFDARRGPFTILELERKLSADFVFRTGGAAHKVRFYGLADRVDLVPDGLVSIVDYKTGSPHADFAGVESLFAGPYAKRRPAVLQTFLYSLMADRMQAAGTLPGRDSRPALYYVRMMNRDDYSPYLSDGKTPVENYGEYKEELEDFLGRTLAEMFDPAVPFSQCEETKPCEYCDFNAICRRV